MRKLALKTFAAIPLPILYALSWLLYIFLFYIVRFRRSVAANNIRNSFPNSSKREHQKILKQHYRNFCDVMVEMIKTFDLQPDQLQQRITFKHTEDLEKYLHNEQTIIVAVAHHCNLEWPILATSGHLNYPIDGIYKPLNQKWLNELAVESRAKFNITLTPAKTCVTDLIKRAKQTRIIAIAPDQAPRRRDDAYWTTFLNQETPFYLGLEKIATLFKYPVFFMDLERTSKGHYQASFKQLCAPPYTKDTNLVSKRFAQAVEEQVLRQPEDWLWIHKRWKKKKSLYD